MFQDDQHDSKLFVFLVKFMAGTSLQRKKFCSSWSRSCFFFTLVIQFLSYTLSHPNEKHSYSMFNGKKTLIFSFDRNITLSILHPKKLLSILNKKCKQNNTKLCFQTKNCAAFVLLPLLPLLLLLEYCYICTGNVSSRMWF